MYVMYMNVMYMNVCAHICINYYTYLSSGSNSPKDYQIRTEPATFIAACRDCGCPGRGASDRDCRGHGDFANARDCPAPSLWSGTAARVGD
jgi:hypothetical protein